MVDGYLQWFLVCFGNRYEAPFLFETDTKMYSSVQLPLLVPDVMYQEMEKVETFCR